ncbi:MAG: hypothetical protein K6B75_08270, partial [Lachnospiraceae bacterium]|nr:hypothetical protein [Lachnospiraceae bacterium]
AEQADVMLKYVTDKILNDYENFSGVAQNYSDDAVKIDQMLKSFKDSTSVLADSMEDIINGVDGISQTVDESANAVTDAAHNTRELVTSTDNVRVSAQSNKRIAVTLQDDVKKFSKV